MGQFDQLQNKTIAKKSIDHCALDENRDQLNNLCSNLEGELKDECLAIVNEARRVCGSKEFRTPETKEGDVACSQVVTEILKRSGMIKPNELSDLEKIRVRATMQALRRKGWKEIRPSEKPKAGDVIVWDRGQVKDLDGEGIFPAKHLHIGIITDPEKRMAVSNNSKRRTPMEHKIDYRPILAYFRPPKIHG
ncbi:MAG: CHAP domain-containing protein [Candidatus Gracilibacteria bacterium]|jgi:hypothetical protein